MLRQAMGGFALAMVVACSSSSTKTNMATHSDGAMTTVGAITGDGGNDSAAAAQEVHKIDRSGLTDVGTTGHLDYSNPNYWMCRPDIDPNECHRSLDATQIDADGTRTIVKH